LIIPVLEFSGHTIADGLEQPIVIEPVHPFERRELDRFKVASRSALADKFGFLRHHNQFVKPYVRFRMNLRA
jgi:hypothetical protein